MPEKTEQKILDFINIRKLLPDKAKALLAVSGGADSVGLLKILLNLKLSDKINNDFHIAHINHQLRGEKSLQDENFVKAMAEKYKLPITIERVDVKKYAQENKLSIETAARSLRLAALCRIANENNCQFVATAHHKNDNAETVIHRMLRGTGFKGLAGIRPKTIINNKTFIRPLLCLTRQEIEECLKNQSIRWQNDHTNLDCRFTRNRIRHKVLPYLEKSTPNLIELISSLSEHCGKLTASIEQMTQTAVQTCIISRDDSQITVDLNKFLSQPQPVQVELIQSALTQLGGGLQKFTSEHYKKIMDFVKSAQQSKILSLPGKIKITKGHDRFFIAAPLQKSDKIQKEVILSVPGKTLFADWQIETEILTADNLDVKNIKNKKNNFLEWFDLEQIKPPLVVRFRQKGDRFKPFGLGNSKRIGKFITSAKLDPEQRKKTFLICDSGKILWLVPIRRSSEAILDTKSRKILKIKVSRNT